MGQKNNYFTLNNAKKFLTHNTLSISLPPIPLVTVAMFAMFLWLVIILYYAYLPPSLGMSFKLSNDGESIIVKHVVPDGPAAGRLKPGDKPVFIQNVTSGEKIKLLPADINMEPDSVSTYAVYNAFFQRQADLYTFLQQGTLRFILADGTAHTIKPLKHRPITELPWLFWYQLLCGVLTFVAGVSVWASKRNDKVVFYYWLTGGGLLLAASSAAVYSTRELALDAGIFKSLSLINQLGSYLFCGPFIAILWNYPKPVGKPYLGELMVLAFLVFWIMNYFQISDNLDLGMRLPMIGGLAVLVSLAIWQWFTSPDDPLSRAVVKWFLMAWMVSAAVYIGLVTLPLIFGETSIIDQSLAWFILLLVYLGVTAGILKYQLFNIDRWILNFWLWILGGLLVLVIDALLVYVFGLEKLLGLSMALAVAGWLYFPVRQWFWQRFADRVGQTDYRVLYEQASAKLLAADNIDDMDGSWKQQLQKVFKPLKVEEIGFGVSQVTIMEQGLKLAVPALAGDHSLLLTAADGGHHLFNASDSRFANSLWQLYLKAYKFEQAVEQGAMQERKRIARDLHDNVGAKLLSLVYRSEGRKTQNLARESLQQLREVIHGLETTGEAIGDLTYLWFDEASTRCDESGIVLHWQENLSDAQYMLNSRQVLNLKAVFSELLSNVIRHARAQSLEIIIAIEASEDKKILSIIFTDNGQGFEKKMATGRGIHNIKQRISELDGSIHSDAFTEGGTKTSLSIPLKQRPV